MGFKRFSVERAAAPLGTGIAATLAKRGEKPARLGFSVSVAVAAQLGLKDGSKLMVLLGEGDSHGLIRFGFDVGEAGDHAVVEKKRAAKGEWFRIALGVVPGFVDRAEGRKWCRWEKLDDAGDGAFVEIVLPSWADETGPRAEARRLARSPAIRPHEPVRREPGRMPGDPPPGRSALDQKRVGAK